MTSIGWLPPIGARPAISVFKCAPCRRITSRELLLLPTVSSPPTTGIAVRSILTSN